MFFSDMSVTVKEAGFRPVMVEGELADKAKEKSKDEKLFWAKRFESFHYGKILPKIKD